MAFLGGNHFCLFLHLFFGSDRLTLKVFMSQLFYIFPFKKNAFNHLSGGWGIWPIVPITESYIFLALFFH
jgi:hypothetical protein